MSEEEIPTNSGSLPSLEPSLLVPEPIPQEADPDATAAIDLATVAIERSDEDQKIEQRSAVHAESELDSPVVEEVSLNNDAPTRIRVSTMDAYGTQGGHTAATAMREKNTTLQLVVVASLVGASAGLILAFLV